MNAEPRGLHAERMQEILKQVQDDTMQNQIFYPSALRAPFLTETVHLLDFLFRYLTKILKRSCAWVPLPSSPRGEAGVQHFTIYAPRSTFFEFPTFYYLLPTILFQRFNSRQCSLREKIKRRTATSRHKCKFFL